MERNLKLAVSPPRIPNPLLLKLSSFADLGASDREWIEQLGQHARRYRAGEKLIREGDRPERVFLLLEGWGYRYKLTAEGQRQIMAYLLPGDLCDVHIFILKEMDHSIGLLTDALVAEIPKDVVLAAIRDRPAISEALLWATLVDEGTLREWIVNLGQRPALERIAHLFCELWVRLRQVGLVTGNLFTLPLTQEELGDTVGLTSVHTNRTLRRLREDRLIEIRGKQLAILNIEELKRVAGFTSNYLHLNRR